MGEFCLVFGVSMGCSATGVAAPSDTPVSPHRSWISPPAAHGWYCLSGSCPGPKQLQLVTWDIGQKCAHHLTTIQLPCIFINIVISRLSCYSRGGSTNTVLITYLSHWLRVRCRHTDQTVRATTKWQNTDVIRHLKLNKKEWELHHSLKVTALLRDSPILPSG